MAETITHWDDVAAIGQGSFNPTRSVCAKATQGTGFTDSQYHNTQAKATKGSHHFWGYHFLNPGDIAAQARHAYSVLGKTPAMLDLEVYEGRFPSLAEAVLFVKTFRGLGGIMNIDYLPEWFWKEHWKSVSLKPLIDLGMHNQLSDYSVGSDPGAGSAVMKGFGGLPVLGLQYTSKPHDMNLAYRTWDETWAIITGKPPVTYVHPTGSRHLKYVPGAIQKGHDVIWVQQHIGVQHMGKATGETNALFKSGVEWWQRAHKLEADADVGPNTWKSMGVAYTGK